MLYYMNKNVKVYDYEIIKNGTVRSQETQAGNKGESKYVSTPKHASSSNL